MACVTGCFPGSVPVSVGFRRHLSSVCSSRSPDSLGLCCRDRSHSTVVLERVADTRANSGAADPRNGLQNQDVPPRSPVSSRLISCAGGFACSLRAGLGVGWWWCLTCLLMLLQDRCGVIPALCDTDVTAGQAGAHF